jgi:hypothetical protein
MHLFWPPLLWTAVAERSGDTAFDFTEALGNSKASDLTPHQCGVAPSQWKKWNVHAKRSAQRILLTKSG